MACSRLSVLITVQKCFHNTYNNTVSKHNLTAVIVNVTTAIYEAVSLVNRLSSSAILSRISRGLGRSEVAMQLCYIAVALDVLLSNFYIMI